MATKLNVNAGSDIGKKLWRKHQDNEYTHVDNYKEAICLNCFSKDAAAATIADICGECAGKRGREPLLTKIMDKMNAIPRQSILDRIEKSIPAVMTTKIPDTRTIDMVSLKSASS